MAAILTSAIAGSIVCVVIVLVGGYGLVYAFLTMFLPKSDLLKRWHKMGSDARVALVDVIKASKKRQ